REPRPVVPLQRLAQVPGGEPGEHQQGDHLLHALELRRTVDRGPQPVGGDLQGVLEEGDAPAGQDHQAQRRRAVLQVPVPGEGHEDVGAQQQERGEQAVEKGHGGGQLNGKSAKISALHAVSTRDRAPFTKLKSPKGNLPMMRASQEPSGLVLIVEDNRNISEMVGEYLEGRGFEVDYASDGLDGYRLASENSYDVVVLGLMLPRLDGVEVCKRLREEARKSTPVLMLTARDTLDEKLAGLGAGADDYLVKPFAVEELEARLRALIRRER